MEVSQDVSLATIDTGRTDSRGQKIYQINLFDNPNFKKFFDENIEAVWTNAVPDEDGMIDLREINKTIKVMWIQQKYRECEERLEKKEINEGQYLKQMTHLKQLFG
tara:strand:+ start:145 stop:462 length:318 start_codon:yes stop_codon:yes gene_type:complete